MRFFLIDICLLLIVFYCKNKEITEPEPGPSIHYSIFSGQWEGTYTIIKKGRCTIAGGDTLVKTANMLWAVSDVIGTITIEDSTVIGIWGEGKIKSDLSVQIIKYTMVNCQELGIVNVDETTYFGKIEKIGANYNLEIEANEIWCPSPQSCFFRVKYSLSQVQIPS